MPLLEPRPRPKSGRRMANATSHATLMPPNAISNATPLFMRKGYARIPQVIRGNFRRPLQ